MFYDQESMAEIKRKYGEIPNAYNNMLIRVVGIRQFLNNQRAIEFLTQGVGRRLNILVRCIDNVFRIFPIDRTKHLSREELADIGINLHAFFVNVAGLLDNMAWVFIHEKDLIESQKDGGIKPIDIGLFKEKTQRHLPDSFREYLMSKNIRNWYSEYNKNYRDALAHRIPLYLPPSVLDETDQDIYLEIEAKIQDLDLTENSNHAIYDELLNTQRCLGHPSPFFAHSMNEGCRPVYLHAQIIADFVTLEEIIEKFCSCMYL